VNGPAIASKEADSWWNGNRGEWGFSGQNGWY
jgi:hypothetical protein